MLACGRQASLRLLAAGRLSVTHGGVDQDVLNEVRSKLRHYGATTSTAGQRPTRTKVPQ
jgi:hypothetical protein